MKTITAVLFFGILTYAFAANPLKYGGTSCQPTTGMSDFNALKFFSQSWSLTHSTRSVRVTESTICRDYELKMGDDGSTIDVKYGYYENGGTRNRYNIHCNGTKSGTPGLSNFDCYLTNERGEDTHTHIDAYFIATNYDNYCLVYRCVTSDEKFEDNVFVLYRNKDYIPSDEEVKRIIEPYGLGLEQFISRKDATCTNN
uniref:Salivary lipocalin n=1 Tax=Triatoma dimidiata TaxID=72491 RepID=D1MWB5_TRIDM|nr:hypothetical protein Td09 similar to triatin-like salivary lipocalin [Triatoma dimidiata]